MSRGTLYRDEAVVLRTYKLGEADRIVVLLTKGRGKVRAVAKGVRKTKSKFGARLEPTSHIQVQLYEGRELDIVTHSIGGKETVDPARRDPVFLNHAIEQRIGIGEELARLLAVVCVIENAGVDALQTPRMEERRPVDEFTQCRQRKVVQYAHAGKGRYGQVLGTPLNRSPSLAGFVKRDDRLARRRVRSAD